MSGGLTRVGILCTIGVCGTLLFGGLCLTSYCITTLWIFLELCSLSLIPCFYSSENRLSALFQYIVVTSVSSSCFLLAVLCGGYSDNFFVLGFLIKMAVFPFMGWFYKVGTSGGWVVVLLLASTLKLPFLCVPYFLHSFSSSGVVDWCCSFGFLWLSSMFWLLTPNNRFLCCHLLISSSTSLMLLGVNLSSEGLVWLFFMAIGWAVTAVLFFYWTDSSYQGTLNVFLYCFILIACPFSLGMIYKIFVGYFMSSLGAAVLISWVVYSISEQFYLLTWLVSGVSPKTLVVNVLSV